jgi:O-antigen/teichoic acid export membrane protein
MPGPAQPVCAPQVLLEDRPAEFSSPPGRLAQVHKDGRSAFTRHVLLFTLANLFALVGNGVLTFLIPKLLSMESYGYYRLFVLYGSFAGVLHLGLLDGALIRWAARPHARMKAELFPSLAFLLLQHVLFLVPATAVLTVLYRDQPSWLLLAACMAAYALISNIAILGQFALQAEKSFGWLSALTVINPAILLGFVLAARNWKHLTLQMLFAAYLGSWLVVALAHWVALLTKYPRNVRGVRQIWRVGKHNVAVGWSVLLALLLTNIVLSLDRLVVSFSFGIRDFAIYSFAATALAVVNTIILSVSRVVFPYLSDAGRAQMRIRAYSQGEAALMALWAVGLSSYFPMRALITRLLPAYLPSLPILRLLMLATGMTATIYILHANYFRSAYLQGKLMLGVTIGLLASGLFIAIARSSNELLRISWAMIAGIAVWWLADEWLLRSLLGRSVLQIAKTLFFVIACGASLLLSSYVQNLWLATLLYLASAMLFTGFVYWRSLTSLPFFQGWSLTVPDLRFR